MRTTLTLDEDVAAGLRKEMRRSGKSFKEAVNHFLRQGLAAPATGARKRFVVTPLPIRLPTGLSYDNVEDLIEHLEGPLHK